MMRVRRNDGFTLIELMIAVVILGIIVAVAIPLYTDQVVRTNRSEAKTILSQTAQAFERCYSRYGAYNHADCPPAGAGYYPVKSEGGWYQISQPDGTDLTATTYTITAAPQKSQTTRDTECGSFTLSQNGTRAVTGKGTVDDCW